MSEEELIKMRKLLELQKQLMAKRAKKESSKSLEDPFKVLSPYLEEKAKEVLEIASHQYPKLTKYVVKELARLVLASKIKEKINAYTILLIYEELGYPIRLPTRIVVKRKGKTFTLSQYLKKRLEGED